MYCGAHWVMLVLDQWHIQGLYDDSHEAANGAFVVFPYRIRTCMGRLAHMLDGCGGRVVCLGDGNLLWAQNEVYTVLVEKV